MFIYTLKLTVGPFCCLFSTDLRLQFFNIFLSLLIFPKKRANTKLEGFISLIFKDNNQFGRPKLGRR